LKRRCDHCRLEFDESVLIKDDGLFFCCKGCQGIYRLLNSSGLDGFYEKLGSNTLEPPKEGFEESSRFDAKSFQDRYIKERDGYYEIALIIEGIHCSACVWLNEKILLNTEGIIEATLNYTTHKAKIVWDPSVIKLSEIIEKIRSIGYNAYAYDPALQERGADILRKEYYTRMVVGLFCTMNIMWIAVAQYAGFFMGMHKDIKTILNVAEWILATPALFFSGWVFFRSAYYGLKNKMLNMDLLVIAGALLTYIYSIYATVTMRGETYFESATMIVTFVLVGKFLEIRSKKSAVDILDKLNSQIPQETTVLRNGIPVVIPVGEVEIGEILELRAGDRVPLEAILDSDEAEFDESMITGESMPVLKKRGEEVISGSINSSGMIRLIAHKKFADSLLSNITAMVEDALSKKPKIQERANAISKHFTVAILSVAIFTFAGWFLVGGDFEKAFIISVAVIIIACPCALALATPVATTIGVGEALKRGVLFKEAATIEAIALSKTLLLDKTGTITKGLPRVYDELLFKEYDRKLLLSLVADSNHPVAKGIKEYLKLRGVSGSDTLFAKEIKGFGVKAEALGSLFLLGSYLFMKKEGVVCNGGEEGTFFAIDGEVVARFLLRDEIREDAKTAIEGIKKLGLKVAMITGDASAEAKRVGDMVGIDEVYYRLTPEEKSQKVKEYQKVGGVITVGDGINDTVALGLSDVSIAMGGGAEATMGISDVLLLKESMENLKEAIVISKRTYGFIKQNLAISLIYNIITVPLAAAGLIIPMIAAVSMSLSSILVVGNSLRIKR